MRVFRGYLRSGRLSCFVHGGDGEKEKRDEEGYERWVVLRPYIMAALAALAPLRMDIQSDTFCIAANSLGSTTR